MAEMKTRLTKASVARFLEGVADPQRRADCRKIIELMREATGEPPRMWGPSIIGFGQYHYAYKSGREGDMCLIGFSPRKAALTLYVLGNYAERDALLKKLGKHKASGCCLHLKRLADVDIPTLKKILRASIKHTQETRRC
jgi:hypothetical protein